MSSVVKIPSSTSGELSVNASSSTSEELRAQDSPSTFGEFCAQDLWALMNIGKNCPVPEFNSVKEEFLNPLLIHAIQAGDIEKVRLLIHLGVDINDNDPDSWTPLHSAARCGYREILKLLIQHGANVNAVYLGPEKLGQTPLYHAALMNHIGCAKTLLLHGAKQSMGSEEICDPILVAVFKGHVGMATLLFKYGANINSRFTNNFFRLFKTSLHPDAWKDQDLPLLHFATLTKSWSMVAFLLIRGADTEIRTKSGKSALRQAVDVQNFEMVKYLMTHKEPSKFWWI